VSDVAKTIADNVARLRERIREAAQRSGRDASAIKLIAVTKYVDSDAVRALVEAGCVEIGESRPQELWRKAEDLRELPIHWHMIGHLQRNKVRRTLPFVALLHSGDSLRLLAEVDRVSGDLERTTPALLEINISGDETKHGFTPGEMEGHLHQIAELSHLKIRGLMAMAGREGDLDSAREDFARMRELRDQLQQNCPPSVSLEELSMGMSGDFEVAIEEGATIVRVGSALFEGVLW
jgi:pyridoxal phosphate enzyme (YggS family)